MLDNCGNSIFSNICADTVPYSWSMNQDLFRAYLYKGKECEIIDIRDERIDGGKARGYLISVREQEHKRLLAEIVPAEFDVLHYGALAELAAKNKTQRKEKIAAIAQPYRQSEKAENDLITKRKKEFVWEAVWTW